MSKGSSLWQRLSPVGNRHGNPPADSGHRVFDLHVRHFRHPGHPAEFYELQHHHRSHEGRRFANYAYLLTGSTSEYFYQALGHTVVYAVVRLAFDVTIALLIASCWIPTYAQKFLRASYFAPVVVPVVASSLIWIWFYDVNIGPFNQILSWIGLPTSKWLLSEKTSLMSILIFSIWKGLGYNVILFLAGLQNISDSYLEAGRIDGATSWQLFWKIKLPLLRPIVSFVLMMDFIEAFKVFTEVNVIDPGRRAIALDHAIVNYIYELAFTNGRMGRASACALILFVIHLYMHLYSAQNRREQNRGLRLGRVKRMLPRHKRLVNRNWILFIILMIGALSMLFPFVWMTLSSFKTKADVYSFPPRWIPTVWTWDNFKRVFEMIPFLRYYLNSIYTSLLQTGLVIGISILGAYALTKLRFPGQKVYSMFLLSSMFVPAVVTMIPLYLVVSSMGLNDTYAGIVLPQISTAFTTMLLSSFFPAIPNDLVDAARAGRLRALRSAHKVFMPNSKGGNLHGYALYLPRRMEELHLAADHYNQNGVPHAADRLEIPCHESRSEYQVMMAGVAHGEFAGAFGVYLCRKTAGALHYAHRHEVLTRREYHAARTVH
jgi:ABC-type sugar transport system permease subunit